MVFYGGEERGLRYPVPGVSGMQDTSVVSLSNSGRLLWLGTKQIFKAAFVECFHDFLRYSCMPSTQLSLTGPCPSYYVCSTMGTTLWGCLKTFTVPGFTTLASPSLLWLPYSSCLSYGPMVSVAAPPLSLDSVSLLPVSPTTVCDDGK